MAKKDYSTYSNILLIEWIKENDDLAFRELYQRFYSQLYIHAYKRIDDPQAIEDLLQDVFTSVWNNRHKLKIEHSVSGYLYTAVRYKIINYFFRQDTANKYLNSLESHLNEQEPIQADYLVRERQLMNIIEKEINALPPAMRRVFKMSRFDQLSHKEIASTLQLSEQTIKTQVKKALRILKQKLPVWAYIFLLIRFLLFCIIFT